jgi:hypothetical protein
LGPRNENPLFFFKQALTSGMSPASSKGPPNQGPRRTPIPAPNPDSNTIPLMNRGWYLAIEYPILSATPDFQRRLESTRKLGRFQELLEDDGSITFRNLLRADQLKDAWNILNALQAWKAKVQLYLNGSPISWKLASDIAWCAGYLVGEDPCYGDAKARRLEVGCEAKIQFAPFHWSRREDKRRHVFSFARLAPDLGLRFEVEGILEFLGRSQLARDCPMSPIHHRERWEQALQPVSLHELGWQHSLSLAKRHRLTLGENYKTREHSFLPKSYNHGLLGQVPLELRLLDGQPALFKLEDPSTLLDRAFHGFRPYARSSRMVSAFVSGDSESAFRWIATVPRRSSRSLPSRTSCSSGPKTSVSGLATTSRPSRRTPRDTTFGSPRPSRSFAANQRSSVARMPSLPSLPNLPSRKMSEASAPR